MRYPQMRLRRLRDNPKLRAILSEHELSKKDLVQPLFVKEGLRRRVEIASMPGQFQHSKESLVNEALKLESLGVPAVILFGIPAKKDALGSAGFSKTGVVQRSVAALKKRCKDLLVITDVCLCGYTGHGHCGHVVNDRVDNDASVKTLTRIALSHAEAGADVVAPSDMMDGRVGAIRKLLDQKGYTHLPIISYAVKYASSFYAPFREAVESKPRHFGGAVPPHGGTPTLEDRAGYQMNPANAEEALREAGTDLSEGADILLVKPALSYGDIIRRIRDRFGCPVGAYCVSGEYAMIKAAAMKGFLDEKKTVLETHLSLKRAGASLLFTYWARNIAGWLKK